jgi:hypothetical protein
MTKDNPSLYNENQIVGLIQAMSMKQREMLLSKIASSDKNKGKQEEDRELSFQSDNNEGF